ncbi:MAG: esterase-like activity of phytase family protein [Allorhizobium sp.]
MAADVAAPIISRQIDAFRSRDIGKRFGAFEFLGGIEMSSNASLFGAWSSIRFLPDGIHFIGVLDTGHWLSGAVARDAEGRLSGLADVSISEMLDGSGRRRPGKSSSDAESLALRGDQVFVGFEQRHRVDVYPLGQYSSAASTRSLPLPFPVRELRGNGGLETLVSSPLSGPLAGGLVTIAEKSIDSDGHLYAGILDGPLKGAFRVMRRDDFDVTDGAFLPDGDLLVLERRFAFSTGIGMRIRRIKGADIRPGAVVDGEILLVAGNGDQIDNMEGLDVVTGADGSTHVILVADDNHSILQRNLMLEFRLDR